jgi:hypothetical protein
MSTDPERGLEHTTDELDERLKKLGEHIDDAEQKAPDATPGDKDGEEDPEGAPQND